MKNSIKNQVRIFQISNHIFLLISSSYQLLALHQQDFGIQAQHFCYCVPK